jgi:hypothetical protein
MSEERDDQERPCLHCMMVELIDEFFAEYPATTGEPDTIDTDEVVTAIAKTVAELTCGRDGTIRQQLIEQLMREVMNYDAEFRRDAGTGAIGSDARHYTISATTATGHKIAVASHCAHDSHSAWGADADRALLCGDTA